MAEKDLVSQEEIERLMGGAAAIGPAAASVAASPAAAAPAGSQALDQSEIEALLGGTGKPAAPSTGVRGAAAEAPRPVAQEDVEKLLSRPATTATRPKPAPPPERPKRPKAPGESQIPSGDLEYLLEQAEKAIESVTADTGMLPPSATAFPFLEFGGVPASVETATLDLISDVELDLRIELGRTSLYLEEVLKLRKGSVVPLDKLAGDPVDIYVNGRLIAKGEVLVLNDNFCVRVAELIAGVEPES